MPLTLLNCTTTYPDDSTHPSSTDHTTHFNDTSVPTWQLFFATYFSINYCELIIIFHQHHHPSFWPHTPFHVTDDPKEFQFFQFCQSTVTIPLVSLHTRNCSVLPLRFSLLRLYTFSYPTWSRKIHFLRFLVFLRSTFLTLTIFWIQWIWGNGLFVILAVFVLVPSNARRCGHLIHLLSRLAVKLSSQLSYPVHRLSTSYLVLLFLRVLCLSLRAWLTWYFSAAFSALRLFGVFVCPCLAQRLRPPALRLACLAMALHLPTFGWWVQLPSIDWWVHLPTIAAYSTSMCMPRS